MKKKRNALNGKYKLRISGSLLQGFVSFGYVTMRVDTQKPQLQHKENVEFLVKNKNFNLCILMKNILAICVQLAQINQTRESKCCLL